MRQNKFRRARYSIEYIGNTGSCQRCGKEAVLNRFILSKWKTAKTAVLCDDCISGYICEYKSRRPVYRALLKFRNDKHFRRITALSLAILIVLSAFINILFGAYKGFKASYEDFQYRYANHVDLYEPESYRFGYYQLDSTEKEIYLDCLKNAVTSTEYLDDDYSDESKKTALVAYYNDYPEYFWYKRVWDYDDNDDDKYDYSQIGTWDASSNEIDEFRSRVNEIVTQAGSLNSDYAKIKFIYDWLTQNVYYDDGMLDQTDSRESYNYSKEEWQTWSAYGAIVNKRAVCQGIARAFELLMHELGYKCGYVTGEAGGGRHGWNILLLDGKEYYFDVTWDCNDDKSSCSKYDYFFITRDEILRNHTPDVDYQTGCQTEFYNNNDYFIMNGLYFDEYSFNKAETLIDKYWMNDGVYMKFASREEYEAAISDISNIGDYYESKLDIDESYYLHNDTMFTIIIVR